MPRKTSQAVKKDTAEANAEKAAPRRSSRAVAVKPDQPTKDISRSRRSSTAAQTAASVADSRSSRGRSGSQRESASPSEGRGRETPATRVKSSRRSASHINYKESDGEEEANPPKFDENFDSGEDFEESDSDEKSKPRSRVRSTKTSSRGSKGKAKSPTKGRRGRPSKKKDEEEENETVELSDDSNDDVAEKKNEVVTAAKGSPRPARSRRQTSEVIEVKTVVASESKTRRSGRSSVSKDDSVKKRPSRSTAQQKKYTEEEEDIEEVIDEKVPVDVQNEGKDSRKRKRGSSPEEINKRIKDDDEEPELKDTGDVMKSSCESASDEKNEKAEIDAEEPMDVDETDSSKPSAELVKDTESKGGEKQGVTEESKDEKNGTVEEEIKPDDNVLSKENIASSKEDTHFKKEEEKVVDSVKEAAIAESPKMNPDAKPLETASLESSTKAEVILKESSPQKHSTGETKVESFTKDSVTHAKVIPPKQKEVVECLDSKISPVKSSPDKKAEKIPAEVSKPNESPLKATESITKPVVVENEESKPETTNLSSVPVVSTLSSVVPDPALNGSEQNNPPPKAEANDVGTSVKDHTEKSVLKENGDHNDVQNLKFVPPNDQYYSLPGRKYVVNSKLSENLLQSVKNQVFGFVSYNLGTPNVDFYALKEKLLSELNKLDAHLICLQQVGKHFYSTVLEPRLDALGFKSVFCQPEDSLKGMATFYKSSLFRLSTKSDLSLKKLIEKEIDTSTTLGPADKAAVKSQLRKCGNVLFTHFSSVVDSQTVIVANVQIPPTDLNTHALQVSCLAQEVLTLNGGTKKPILLGGEFNIAENDASYQLLRDGYLSNDMIEELSQRRDVSLPGKENTSLLNLFWNSFQHPSCNLCSCYTSVLGKEFFIPELKASSPDLLWYNVNSLHAVGVLDVASDKLGDRHLSLKADIAFSH